MEYGFLARDRTVVSERLAPEMNQVGLPRPTVLKKRGAFHCAFARFDIDPVAAFGAADRERLLADVGIIRECLKTDAVI